MVAGVEVVVMEAQVFQWAGHWVVELFFLDRFGTARCHDDCGIPRNR